MIFTNHNFCIYCLPYVYIYSQVRDIAERKESRQTEDQLFFKNVFLGIQFDYK